MKLNTIIQGDCLEVMKDIPADSVDAIVTDPPYELGFMGKSWDASGIAFNQAVWALCRRVLKPGGHLLSFGGTRTYHRMACAIEDAGFEVRDMIEWVYGSGFPKSLNIGKAVDKLQGNERNNVGKNPAWRPNEYVWNQGGGKTPMRPEFKTKGTSEWEGWGTALKPAHEPICMARKPLTEKTVAENVLKYGTGGINIDESRVGTETINIHNAPKGTFAGGEPDRGSDTESYRDSVGRFPANLIHDNSEEVRECFPESKSSNAIRKNNGKLDDKTFGKYNAVDSFGFNDSGNASRFFKSIIYQAKASKNERNKGCEELENVVSGTKTNERTFSDDFREFGDGVSSGHKNLQPQKNNHPTVKPIALMEYLISMVSREGQTVLDPFIGSGTTGIACKNLNRNYIGIEISPDYCEIARKRISSIPERLSKKI